MLTLGLDKTTFRDKEPDQRDLEDKYLHVGYASNLQNRWPFNGDYEYCLDENDAVVLDMENTYMTIPQEFEFENLTKDIPQQHHGRLGKLWERVKELHYKLDSAAKSLEWNWNNAPQFLHDKGANRVMKNTPVKIRSKYRRAVTRMISSPEKALTKWGANRVEHWQTADKAFRKGFFEAHKNFITCLRSYYSLLLEESYEVEGQEKRYVLAKDHPLRKPLAEHIEVLKVLDSGHAGMAVGKAAHHQQEEGRLRKTAKVPYVNHVLAVTNALIVDVLPYVIDAIVNKTQESVDIVLLALAAPLHDLKEDTTISGDHFDDLLARLVNKYDSSFNHLLVSGFGTKSKNLRKSQLDILTTSRREELRQLLRILSNNTVLTKTETKKAFKRNIVGTERIAKALKISDKDIPLTERDKENLPEPCQALQRFPKEFGSSKHTDFLVRLSAIGTGKTKQHALMLKCEDRADNMRTLKGLQPESCQRELRGTVSRLIAYCMLDHDHDKYPLLDTLPRLIDDTIKAYAEFEKDHPDRMTDVDQQLKVQLQLWKVEVPRKETAAQVNKVVSIFRAKTKAA